MDFKTAISRVLRNYATFDGRAQRAEFWYWFLFVIVSNMLIAFVETTINAAAPGNAAILTGAFSLAVFLPGLAVLVRRLHDTGRSGFWAFLTLVPVLGGLILLIWTATTGTRGPNEYGPDPLDPDTAAPSTGSGETARKSDIPKVPRD